MSRVVRVTLITVVIASVSVANRTVCSGTTAHSYCNSSVFQCYSGGNTCKEELDKLDQLLDLIPKFSQILPMNVKNLQCANQSGLVLHEAQRLKLWALNMLDSWGKVPSGILRGNLNQFGDYDQCLSVSSSVNGQYCLATFDVKLSSRLAPFDDLIHSHYEMVATFSDPGHRLPKFSLINWAFCIPATCTARDLQEVLQHSLITKHGLQISVQVDDGMCSSKNGKYSVSVDSNRKHYAQIFFTFWILLIAWSTVYDIWKTKSSESGRKIIKAFSLRQNFQLLMDTEKKSDEVSCLHGIRALNSLALLLSHKQMALLFIPYTNRIFMAQVLGMAWSAIGRTAIIYTDSFILLSGFLTAKGFLASLDRKKNINFFDNFLSRLIRLTPNLIALIMFCTYILPGLGSGPLWNSTITEHSILCQKYWWRNMLYIHNYYGFENMCLTHTHQLGLDMQLFLASPFLVYVVWRWHRRGFLVLVGLAIISTVLRYYITMIRKLSTVVYFGIPVSQAFATADYTYILPTHRATVYIMGILLCCYLHYNSPVILSKKQIIMGWVAALILGLLAVFGPYRMCLLGYKFSVMDAAVYNAFSPIAWSLFICWVIFSSVHGYAGFFGKFLSWRGFSIITKISYAVYLTQFPVFFYTVGSKRVAEYYSVFKLFDMMEYSTVLLVSIVMTLLFDLPAQNVKKILWPTIRGETHLKENHVNQHEYLHGTTNHLYRGSAHEKSDNTLYKRIRSHS